MRSLLGVFLAAFLGCCAAIAGVWSGDRAAPTETISMRVEPSIVPAGAMGEVQYVFQRFRSCDRRSVASVVDATGRSFEFAPQTSPPTTGRVPGTANSYTRPFRVSSAAKPGPAIYRVEIEDYCNPLQWVWPIKRSLEVPFVIADPVTGPGASYQPTSDFMRAVLQRFAGVED